MELRALVRGVVVAAIAVAGLAACKRHHPGGDDGDGDANYQPDACDTLGCFIVDCASKGLPPTSISGTVFAPNGTLPLYGVNVYVPASDPGPLPQGAICDRCANGLQGGAYTQTSTDEAGNFTLRDVPATGNVPVVIQTGKWRRQFTIPNVAACADLPIAAADTTLPKSKAEGDLPKIAISTGDADALECLAKKLGIADSEFSTKGGTGNVHLYDGENGASSFQANWPGGTTPFAQSNTELWNTVDNLKPYDIAFLSCEGNQNPGTKLQPALTAMKDYADLGGRVFLSHWHNIWIEGAHDNTGDAHVQQPAVWGGTTIAGGGIADWNNNGTQFSTPPDVIDEMGQPKGMSFATWMVNVMGSPPGMRGIIPIGALPQVSGKNTVTRVDTTRADRWVYWPSGGVQYPQIFQFTTPNEAPAANRCGKVVFSDMHVSGDSSSSTGTAFPGQCSTMPLTPQEKALAFIFFDISSCVGPLL